MNLLRDPRFFSGAVVVLFALASVRWAFEGNLKQTLYWGAGCMINFVMTFMADK